jgi:hypothetical protein
MQNFSRETCLLKDFYSRHKPLIDALARDDEMFRMVKEIAETKDAFEMGGEMFG